MPIFVGDKQLPEPNNVVFDGDNTITVYVGATQVYPELETNVTLAADVTQFPAAGGTINLTATGQGPAPLTYDFQENVNGGGWVSFQSGASNVASRAVTVNNTDFRCVLTDGNLDSFTSNVIQTTVNAVPTFGQQPTSISVPQGQTGQFSVVVVGGAQPITYQWRKNGVPISGATGPTYTTPNVDFADDNGDLYDVVVTDNLGQQATSNTATLTVTTPAVSISITPTSVEGEPGDSVTWTATVSGGYGTKSLQWRLDNVDIGGQTGTTYQRTLALSDDGSFIDCRVTDAAGKTADSNNSTMTVEDSTVVPVPPPSILPPGYINGTGFLYIAEPSKMFNWSGQRPVVGDQIFSIEEYYGNGAPLEFRAAYPQSYAPILRFSSAANRYYLEGTRNPTDNTGSIYLIYSNAITVAANQFPFGWYVGHFQPANTMVITNIGLMRDFTTDSFNASVVAGYDPFNPTTRVQPDMRLFGSEPTKVQPYAANAPIIGVFGGQAYGTGSLASRSGIIDGQWVPFNTVVQGGTGYTNMRFGIPWMPTTFRWYEMCLGWAPGESLTPTQVQDVYNNRRAAYPTL